MSNTAHILFPHQLFEDTTHLCVTIPIYLVEESLFFNQYKFHKQKIAFHRASMRYYFNFLKEKGFQVSYIEAKEEVSSVSKLINSLIEKGITNFNIINPTDNWLEKSITKATKFVKVNWIDNLLFLNTADDLASFFKPSKKKFYQTTFYKQQRKTRNILLEKGKPKGGKWTFDVDNRKKYPKDKTPPLANFSSVTSYHKEAKKYVNEHFAHHYGSFSDFFVYPISHQQAICWFHQFLQYRFHEFGAYEDAIVRDETILHHSVLSPLLNVGLLAINEVVHTTLQFAKENDVPINSVEGFIRQIVGWREFIRGVYQLKGTEERTKNFWNHQRAIPQSFYNATTGILPIDTTIKKVLQTGYVHHIERLMLLGNFMLLCEFHPNQVYQWFMEMFIDAYDWVMVPNVYGMSLYADGGLMSTKPYISSSNYILKMSNYPKGDWQNVWDGLFWRFMSKNRAFFESNPRLSMLVHTLDRMSAETKAQHSKYAEEFLQKLDTN